MKKLLSLIIVLIAIIIACKKGDKPDKTADSFDRNAILVNMTENVILPAYQSFQAKAGVMDSKIKSFLLAPSEASLTAARQAWIEAYTEWQKVALFAFGPAEQEALLSNFNVYPAKVTAIESNASGASSYDLNTPVSYDVQGFPAIEYLLYGDNKTNTEIIVTFLNANRAKYLKELSSRVVTLTGKVTGAWQGAYKTTFINASGLDRGSALGNLFNATFLPYMEKYNRDAKFGIPSGQRTGTPAPEKVEGLYSKIYSKQLAMAAYKAYADAWHGVDFLSKGKGASVLDYVRYFDERNKTSLSTKLEIQLLAVKDRITAINDNFYQEASSTNPQKLKDVWKAYQDCVITIKSDIASALSLTISYVDTDGD